MPTAPSNPSLESLYRPLWLTYGLVPLLAGLDKFFCDRMVEAVFARPPERSTIPS